MTDKDEAAKFGEWIRDALAVRGMTAAALAERIGVTPGTVSRWVHGLTKPESRSMQRIAAALDVPLETILTHTGHPTADELRKHELISSIGALKHRLASIEAEHLTVRSQYDTLMDELREMTLTTDEPAKPTPFGEATAVAIEVDSLAEYADELTERVGQVQRRLRTLMRMLSNDYADLDSNAQGTRESTGN